MICQEKYCRKKAGYSGYCKPCLDKAGTLEELEEGKGPNLNLNLNGGKS